MTTTVGPHLAPPSACPTCAPLIRHHTPPSYARQEITSPEAAAELLVPLLAAADREHCLTLNLDAEHRLLTIVTVSIGTLNRTFMAPREVYRDALLAEASAVVVAHNHPSGDPTPSRDDERITRRIAEAGTLLGIELLDHLIIGGTRWISLARRGILD